MSHDIIIRSSGQGGGSLACAVGRFQISAEVIQPCAMPRRGRGVDERSRREEIEDRCDTALSAASLPV